MNLLSIKALIGSVWQWLITPIRVPLGLIVLLTLLSATLWYSVSKNRDKEQRAKAVELQKQVETNLEQVLQINKIRKQNDDLKKVVELIMLDNEKITEKYNIKVDDIRSVSDFELQQQLDSLFSYQRFPSKKK